MQMRTAEPLPGGRLQVEAHAVCRFEVVAPTQALPYSRADVRLLPDDEELDLQAAVLAADGGTAAADSADGATEGGEDGGVGGGADGGAGGSADGGAGGGVGGGAADAGTLRRSHVRAAAAAAAYAWSTPGAGGRVRGGGGPRRHRRLCRRRRGIG
eukprot:2580079-Prymnesium_polylepis.1